MRYVYALITLLLAVACATFAVCNRVPVDVSLWPFPGVETLPLYALSLGTTAVGLLIGLVLGWLRGMPSRLARRRLAQQLTQAEAELKRLRGEIAAQSAAAVPAASAARVDG